MAAEEEFCRHCPGTYNDAYRRFVEIVAPADGTEPELNEIHWLAVMVIRELEPDPTLRKVAARALTMNLEALRRLEQERFTDFPEGEFLRHITKAAGESLEQPVELSLDQPADF